MNGARQRIPFGQVPAGLGVGVVVPAEVERLARLRGQRVDDDHARPGLGQPPGEQAALPPQVPAVAVAQLAASSRFEVERAGHRRVGEHPERGGAELVGPLQRAVAIDVAAEAVEVGRAGRGGRRTARPSRPPARSSAGGA